MYKLKIILGLFVVISNLLLAKSCTNKVSDIDNILKKSSNCMDENLLSKVNKIRNIAKDKISKFNKVDTLFAMNTYDIQRGMFCECIWDVGRKNHICYEYSRGTLKDSLSLSFFKSEYYTLAEYASQDLVNEYQKKYGRFLGGNKIHIIRAIINEEGELHSSCILFDDFHVPGNP